MSERERRRQACELAKKKFSESRGKANKLWGVDAQVLHIDESRVVVRVTYAQQAHGRAWYEISEDGSRVVELSYSDVGRYGERGEFR